MELKSEKGLDYDTDITRQSYFVRSSKGIGAPWITQRSGISVRDPTECLARFLFAFLN